MIEEIIKPTKHRVARPCDDRGDTVPRRVMSVSHIQTAADRFGERRYRIPQRVFHVRTVPVVETEYAFEYQGNGARLQIEFLIADTFTVAAVSEIAGCQMLFEFLEQPVGIQCKLRDGFVVPHGGRANQRTADGVREPVAGIR